METSMCSLYLSQINFERFGVKNGHQFSKSKNNVRHLPPKQQKQKQCSATITITTATN
jgi:hypothetical protein